MGRDRASGKIVAEEVVSRQKETEKERNKMSLALTLFFAFICLAALAASVYIHHLEMKVAALEARVDVYRVQLGIKK